MTTDDPPSLEPPTTTGARPASRSRSGSTRRRPTGAIRTSVLLRYAADLAAVHFRTAWASVEPWYRERDLAWLVRGVELTSSGRRPMARRSSGRPEAIAARKVIARRVTEFGRAPARSRAQR